MIVAPVAAALASILENAVRSESFFGMWFGVLLPFAHFGEPVMSIITRMPFFDAF